MPDLKTKAIILKRINFRESDRILTILTPEGRLTCLAKGVRKEKSKLAGGIEMFSLSDVIIHEDKTSKQKSVVVNSSLFGILTSAKTRNFYSNIIADFETLELASSFLKRIYKITAQFDSQEIFTLLSQTLFYLDRFSHDTFKKRLLEIYFILNLSRICGEEINMLFDYDNQKLAIDSTYDWDSFHKVLVKNQSQTGQIDQNIIKIVRLMLSTKFSVILQIKNIASYLPSLSQIEQSFR